MNNANNLFNYTSTDLPGPAALLSPQRAQVCFSEIDDPSQAFKQTIIIILTLKKTLFIKCILKAELQGTVQCKHRRKIKC